MNYTNIVTSFLKNDNKILILKRSDKVKSMRNLWAGISGIIEKDDLSPLSRAEIEIFEETGIKREQINLLKEYCSKDTLAIYDLVKYLINN